MPEVSRKYEILRKIPTYLYNTRREITGSWVGKECAFYIRFFLSMKIAVIGITREMAAAM